MRGRWTWGLAVTVTALGLGVGLALLGTLARPAHRLASGFAPLAEMAHLDDQITDVSIFTPPADGTLTRSQVERFVRVERRVRASLGPAYQDLEQRARELREEVGSDAGGPGVGEALVLEPELADLLVEAKREQVVALNDEGFSKSEYQWVEARVYQALGIRVHPLTLEEVERLAASGSLPPPLERISAADQPLQNLEAVAPYRGSLEQGAALAVFGL